MRKDRRFLPNFRIFSSVIVALLAAFIAMPRPLYAQSEGANLLSDPGFESENGPWEACGDATRVDAQAEGVTPAMVHSGRYAFRIHYDTDDLSCGGEAFFDPTAQVGQSFTVPADAQDLTISFWYSRVGDTYFPLQPILGTSSDYDGRDVTLAWVEPEELEGWNFYRTELNLQELEAVRGKTISLFFSIFTVVAQSASEPGALPDTAAPGSYYIDDVRVTTTVERTTPSPLPADLQGDGMRPLVYLNADGVARLNTDGSDPQPIYGGFAGVPLNPVWSSAGDRIAVLEHSLTPENNTDPAVIPAFITILNTIDADGGNLQEVYRTSGIPGKRATPVDDEVPALSVEIRSMDWSPDDTAMALTLCSYQLFSNGSTTDEICWIEVIELASGNSLYKIERAYRASWSGDNRLIFENSVPMPERVDGIWEVDLNADPPVETLLIPGTGAGNFLPSIRTENWAVWSPDNTKFATVRDVAGFHYNPNGIRVFHDAIMVFDRASLVGETVLLVDHGTDASGFTWSPDGKYLLYNLTQGQDVDIWWLEVATGKTRKLTSNGASIAANWRPACIDESCGEPNGNATLRLPLLIYP